MNNYITIKASSEEACWDKVGDFIERGYVLYQLPHRKWWDRSMWRAKMEAPRGQLELRCERRL